MKFQVIVLSEAEQDLDNAFIWYELKQIGLGDNFFKTVNNSIKNISDNQAGYIEIYKNVRRFVIEKFPYGIYDRVNFRKKEIRIIGVIHFKRNVTILKKRI